MAEEATGTEEGQEWVLGQGRGRGLKFRLGGGDPAGDGFSPAAVERLQANCQIHVQLEKLHLAPPLLVNRKKSRSKTPGKKKDKKDAKKPLTRKPSPVKKVAVRVDAVDGEANAKARIHAHAECPNKCKAPAGPTLPLSVPPPLEGNERRYLKADELHKGTKVKLNEIRPTLRAAFQGCVKYLQKNEKATSQVLGYPTMTELECSQLIILARRVYDLHAMGIQHKTGEQERYIILYKKNPAAAASAAAGAPCGCQK